ncbi:TIGR00266 family protein [Pasteuria penetrans]|uniref:TIGR00266 family protein n=1 Tax=Pasteuria penetrans TaxID=86005 RepID=UPI000FB10037|nr:TIGR00266 family protein [Pasteuria penetrans]
MVKSADEIDYRIFGHETQFVEIELDPQEGVIAEAGAMMAMEEAIQMETVLGGKKNAGLMNKLIGAGKLWMVGEKVFLTVFTNTGFGKQRVYFAAPYPGSILALDLRKFGNQIIAEKHAFLCAAHGVSIEVAFRKKIRVGFFGGEGFVMQKLAGDGLVFIHAGGCLWERELAPNEVLRVDTGCLAAMTSSVDYAVQYVGTIKSAVFGGEGIFFVTLRGPGHVWLQSLPFVRLASRVMKAAAEDVGEDKGGVLGKALRAFDD